MALDVYPTLLALAGAPSVGGTSLLEPRADRVRLAEYPAIFSKPFQSVAARATPGALERFRRRLRALLSGPFKLIEGEDGNDELYDLRSDPGERNDLSSSQPETRTRMREMLFGQVRDLAAPPAASPAPGRVGEREAQLLRELGYAEDSHDAAEIPPTFSAPSSWKLDPDPVAN
jgi:hypothetical protein